MSAAPMSAYEREVARIEDLRQKYAPQMAARSARQRGQTDGAMVDRRG